MTKRLRIAMFLLTGLILLSLIPFIKVSGIPPVPMNISGYVFIQKTGGPKMTAPAGLNVTARQHTTILNIQGSTLTNAQGYYMIGVSGVANGTLIDIWVQGINVTRITFIYGKVIDETDGGNFTVIDTVPPSIQIISPQAGGKVPMNQPAWINATLTDNLAINASTIKMTLNQTQVSPTFNLTTGLLSYETSPLTKGLYIASISVEDIAGNTATETWNFTATPPSTPHPTISPTSATLDVGQSQIFTATVVNGTSPYTYQWYLNGTAQSGATSATWTFTPSSSGSCNVYVNVTDSVGLRAKSNIAAVIVNPTLFVSILPTSPTLDVGKSQAFTSTVTGGTTPYTYQWYLNGNPVSGATNPTWTYTPSSAGSNTVYLKVTDSATPTANTQQSTTATLTVNAPPSVTISPTSVTMDVGQNHTLTSTITGGTSPYTYQWYLNGTAITSATSSTYTFTPSSRGHYNIYVTVTDNVGIQATSNNATATVNNRPSVSISPKSATLDVGQSQIFTATVVNGTSPYTYQWYLNGTAQSGATSATWTFTPSSKGNYAVSVTVDDAVSSTAVPVEVVPVTVIPEFQAITLLILMLTIVSALILTLKKRRKPIRTSKARVVPLPPITYRLKHVS